MSGLLGTSARRLGLPGFTTGFLNLLVLGTVMAGMVGGLLLTVRLWLSPEGVRPTLLAVIAVGLAAAGAVVIARRKEPATHRAAIVLLLGIVVTRALYTAAVHQQVFSDFQIMWDYAASIANGGFRPPAGEVALQQARALPFLVPVALLSGGGEAGYQGANALAVGLCALLIYALSCSISGRKAGLLAVWLIAVAPEPVLAAEIPTHDIPGTLFALIFLVMVYLVHRWSLEERPSKYLFGGGILAGLALWLADLQRGIGMFLIGALILAVVLVLVTDRPRKRGRTLVALVVLPIVVAWLGGTITSRVVVGETSARKAERMTWNWVAGYANSESAGDLDDVLTLAPLLSSLDDIQLRRFALARTESDLADAPAARILNYGRRIAGLYLLGAQYHFYLDDTRNGKPWLPTSVVGAAAGRKFGAFFRAYTEAFRVVFLLCGLAALWYVISRAAPRGIQTLPLLFVALLTLGLGLFGEVQPRYLFPLWFIIPIYIGWAVALIGDRAAPNGSHAKERIVEISAAGLLSGILIVLAISGLRLDLRFCGTRLIGANRIVLEGPALAQGRYELRFSPTEGKPTEAKLDMPGDGQIAALVALKAGGEPRCWTRLDLHMNDAVVAHVVVDTASQTGELRAELPGRSGDMTKVSIVGTAPETGAACPVSVWLLASAGGRN